MKENETRGRKIEALDALQLIKDECVLHASTMTTPSGGVIYSCRGCSFYREGECCIRATLPKYWSIADDETVWRAFR